MNSNQTIGFLILSVGVVLSIFAFHEMGVIPDEKFPVNVITDSPVSPTERFPDEVDDLGFIGNLEDKVLWTVVAGVAMVILGGWIAIRSRSQ